MSDRNTRRFSASVLSLCGHVMDILKSEDYNTDSLSVDTVLDTISPLCTHGGENLVLSPSIGVAEVIELIRPLCTKGSPQNATEATMKLTVTPAERNPVCDSKESINSIPPPQQLISETDSSTTPYPITRKSMSALDGELFSFPPPSLTSTPCSLSNPLFDIPFPFLHAEEVPLNLQCTPITSTNDNKSVIPSLEKPVFAETAAHQQLPPTHFPMNPVSSENREDATKPVPTTTRKGKESIRAVSPNGKVTHLFKAEVKKIINQFMNAHRRYPYANQYQKKMLGIQTGLTVSQVSMYMSNWRRRNLSDSEKNQFRRSLDDF